MTDQRQGSNTILDRHSHETGVTAYPEHLTAKEIQEIDNIPFDDDGPAFISDDGLTKVVIYRHIDHQLDDAETLKAGIDTLAQNSVRR